VKVAAEAQGLQGVLVAGRTLSVVVHSAHAAGMASLGDRRLDVGSTHHSEGAAAVYAWDLAVPRRPGEAHTRKQGARKQVDVGSGCSQESSLGPV
jgi:hypothetical protein